jgi:hypothetical protein
MIPYKSEVSVAAASRDLTTLATVKTELNITSNDSNAAIEKMIAQQSAAAETYCKRVFAQETLVDHFRSPGPGALILSRWPVTAITAIVEDDVALSAADFEFDVDTGLVWRLDGSYRQGWFAKAIVTFIAGYEQLPGDVERAVILMVKQAWFARMRDPLVKSVSVDGIGSRDYWVGTVGEGALPPEASSLLDPYRRPSV